MSMTHEQIMEGFDELAKLDGRLDTLGRIVAKALFESDCTEYAASFAATFADIEARHAALWNQLHAAVHDTTIAALDKVAS